MIRRLSPRYIKEILKYCPETGVFTWRKRSRSHFATENSFTSWNTKYAGKVAGTFNPSEYAFIRSGGGDVRERIEGLVMDIIALLIGFSCGLGASICHWRASLKKGPRSLAEANLHLAKAKWYATKNGMGYCAVFPDTESENRYTQSVDIRMSREEIDKLLRAVKPEIE